MIREAYIRLIRKSKNNLGILLINILGLAFGLTVFVLISAWISHELRYDKNDSPNNVYRLSFGTSTYLTAGEGPYFAENCLEIDKVVRFKAFGSALFSFEDKSCKINNLKMADSTVFDIFPYELIQGDKNTVLAAPGNIVISESVSKTLFGNNDPLGKIIKVNGGFDVVVSGVMKEVKHTYNPVDVLGSFVTLRLLNEEPDILESLETSQYQTYFKVKDNISISDLSDKIHRLNIELFEISDPEFENTIELVPLEDLYFHPVHGPRENHGNKSLVMIFLAISILTLIIACINFINLTIAKSSDSTVEVGIRKVSGATKSRLFSSFLTESILLVLFSGFISFILIIIVFPGFANLVGAELEISNYLTPLNIIMFVVLALCIGFLAGIIPALRFSAFDPLVYLRKMSREGRPSNLFRTLLVIFQFTISAILVLAVFVVMKQMIFVKNYNLGINQENVIRIYFRGEIGEKKDLYKELISDIPGVTNVSYSGAAIGGTNFEVFYFEEERYLTQFLTVDPDFIRTLEIDIISGRSFSSERPGDRLNTCILNESAAQLIGIDPNDAPGKIINRRDWYLTTIPSERLEIIGVVKDFNISSLRDSIPPYLICWGNWFSTFNIRISGNNQNQVIRSMEKIWTELNPDIPFEYQFLENMIEDQYSNEDRLTLVLIYFSLLAILIASFGLLGLSSISVQTRTKEIGIRKVHGASRYTIIIMVAGSFLKWVFVSILIGTPISIIIMNRWLSGFAYRIGIDAGIIGLSWLVLIIISMITVLYHTVKISDTNPAESIRHE